MIFSGNPGPCGSGCIVYNGKDGESFQGSKIIGKRGTNNIGELYAIWMALDIVNSKFNDKIKRNIVIFSDSDYSINVLTGKWKIKANKELIGWIKNDIKNIENRYNIVWYWVKGHIGIKGNEIADSLANNAAKMAKYVKYTVDVKRKPNDKDKYKIIDSTHI